jgi:hypothetical protein
MIRILAGTYGYVGKNGFLQPKTAADPPFALSPAEEERLVKLGVAVKVEAETPKEGDAPSASRIKSKRTSEKSS